MVRPTNHNQEGITAANGHYCSCSVHHFPLDFCSTVATATVTLVAIVAAVVAVVVAVVAVVVVVVVVVLVVAAVVAVVAVDWPDHAPPSKAAV